MTEKRKLAVRTNEKTSSYRFADKDDAHQFDKVPRGKKGSLRSMNYSHFCKYIDLSQWVS